MLHNVLSDSKKLSNSGIWVGLVTRRNLLPDARPTMPDQTGDQTLDAKCHHSVSSLIIISLYDIWRYLNLCLYYELYDYAYLFQFIKFDYKTKITYHLNLVLSTKTVHL